MPRSHGRIQSAIWTDADFIALDSEPQRLYLFLLSQPDLSHAGLLPLRVRRWAAKVGHADTDVIRAALAVLAERRFVLVDEDTEELLIRTLVRNDGVYKQPKVMLRMREDAQQIESPALRRAFLAEMNRLPLHELNDKPGGPHGDQASTQTTVAAIVDALRGDFGEPTERVSDTPPDTPSDGHAEPPRARAGAFPRPPAPVPQPPAPVPPTAGRADAPTTQTLVAEWIDHCKQRPPGRVVGQISREVGTMLAEGIPYADVRAGLAAWHDKGLHPSTLASVVHETRNPRQPQNRPSTTDQRVNGALALAARLEAEERPELKQVDR